MDGKFQVDIWTVCVFSTGLGFQWLVLEDVLILGGRVDKPHLEVSNLQ